MPVVEETRRRVRSTERMFARDRLFPLSRIRIHVSASDLKICLSREVCYSSMYTHIYIYICVCVCIYV